jgi:hypothetical protein
MDCFGVQSVDTVGRCTTSYLLAVPACLCCDALISRRGSNAKLHGVEGQDTSMGQISIGKPQSYPQCKSPIFLPSMICIIMYSESTKIEFM